MRDLTPERPGALCYDPSLATSPRLVLRTAKDEDQAQRVPVQGRLIACPRWIEPTFDALAECAEHGHDLALLRGNRVAAFIRSQTQDGVAVRRDQFRRHRDPVACLALARSLVTAKTAGQVAVLRRWARRRSDEDLDRRADACAKDRIALAALPDLPALRGREGIIARTYFGGWPRLLDLPGFQRIPRRALNPINHLLDITYSRLCLTVTLHLINAGFDVALGTLHSDDDHRPTLALDLMEPLRPTIADRFVLGCYRDALDKGWLQEHHGRWLLTTIGRRCVRERWSTWMYGGQRRAGQHHLIETTVSRYQAWICDGRDLPLPAYTG